MNNSPFPSGSRLAAYLRDSGGEEQELSIEQQEKVVVSWARENNYILSHIFKDEASPGSSSIGRIGFQDMMSHFRSHDCREAGIIVWKFSRFARDIDDAQFYRADLRRRGYEIYSLNDNVPSGIDGRFFEAAIDWMNQRYLEDLSTDVKRGLRHLVENYGAVPGTPPKGFKREPLRIGNRRDGSDHIVHRWVPDPEWVGIVQRAFEMRATGKTFRQIQAETHLYNSKNSYVPFFANRLYIGELIFGNLVIPDYCEPIIEREIWDAVQALHKTRQVYSPTNHPRRYRSSFLLSGILHCAKCGSPMNGHVISRRDGAKWFHYVCSRRKRQAGCDAISIPKAAIEDAVLEELKQYILTPDNLAAVQEEARKMWQKNQGKNDKERARIKKQIASLSKKLANITNAIVDSGGSPTLIKELQTLEQREAGLFSQLARLEEKPEPILDLDIKEISARISQALESSERQQIRDLLRNMLHRIDVGRKRGIIRGMIYHYSPANAYRLCPQGEQIFEHELRVKL